MVPDALRPTSCSALSLWGDKTVSGRMMTLRVLEWNLGSENQMGKMSAVTHMKNGDKSITAIGILGLIDIITAINDDGVFDGILDVGSLEEETFVCEGKKCYTYAIRYALENFDNATDVGNYMVENSGDFTWCHNLIISDKDNAYCAEDCVSEVSKKGQGYVLVEEIPYLFNSFWRGSNSENVEGNGIGLFEAKTIALRLGGDILAKRIEETGEMEFVMFLPINFEER